MKRLVALLLLCLPLLGGCELSTMERQTFVLCLSFDLDEEGKLVMGVETPMNGSGTTSAASPEYTVFSATGDDFESTLSMLAASTPCSLNFSQLKLCVFSYELAAKTDLRDYLVKLSNMTTMRPDATVMIAIGKALDVLSEQNPDFGMRLSTHLEIYLERMRNLKLSPATTLITCVRDIGSGRTDPLLAICAVNPALKPKKEESGKASGGSGGSSEEKSSEASAAFSDGEAWSERLLVEEAIAGMLPRTGVNPVEYLGSAAIGNGRVSGLLNVEETQIALYAKRSATLEVAMDGERTQLQIWLPTNEKNDMGITPQQVNDVMKKLQSLHCDALGFGSVCARTVYTDDAWRQLNVERRYLEAELYVSRR
ncbi:MAG: hypothetical protein PHI98_11555 [Eubacteriales bacterium]|nr:hypothetical protein [Eubacteriales bacterium]